MDSKLNLIKDYKAYYSAKTSPMVVSFGEVSYIAIEGQGEPAGIEFTKAVEALYPLAYGIKKICKINGQDFGVPKLEGLWWVKSDKAATDVPRSEWYWKLLIRMPEFVSADIFKSAKDEVFKKKGIDLINKIDFEAINEGSCVQIMHIGSYSTEPDTINLMKKFMLQNGLTENGQHHEIYISDPRKTAPEKMKTILRIAVKNL